MSAAGPFNSSTAAFSGGVRTALTSVFCLVIAGTYVGIGALAHGFGLNAWWLELSTVLVWAGPAQVILISALGAGTAPLAVAIAVSLTGVRLFPMVVTLMPMLRRPGMRLRSLLLPTHFASASMWIESMRLLPRMPREHRLAFCNGLSVGFMIAALSAGFLGSYLSAELPPLFASALFFLTPMSFLMSTARNAGEMMDKLALGFGLVLGTLLTAGHVQLDLLWAGVGGGTLAYGVNRLRRVSA